MQHPGRPYNPEPVTKHVVRVPVSGKKEFGIAHEWGPHEYPLIVMSKKPQEIVALRSIRNNIMDWDLLWPALHKHGGIERLHELPIRSDRIFSDEGKANLMEASRILEKNVKDGKRTAVTCNLGSRRTSGAMYLLHRRMGATHEEALEHSRIPGTKAPFNESEQEHLKQLFEEREKYGG